MPEGVGIPAERDTVKPRFGALNDCFAALMAATKFHLDGPGPSRALDPQPDAAWDARPARVRPAVEGRSSDIHGPLGAFRK